jgi:arabinogalactan endo-1,4-beta-galactosidase
MKLASYILILLLFVSSCSDDYDPGNDYETNTPMEFGGDFSIMKKMEDLGGLYKIDGVVKEGFEIFSENGYTWARLRIFHSPDLIGPVCNNLEYTIQSAQKAKQYGMKVLLNIYYSDSWADRGHQSAPAAWENLSLPEVQDSVYTYTKRVLEAMDYSGVMPDMVQIGNEINNGMIWPYGKLWIEAGVSHWDELSKLLIAGIRGVKEAQNGADIPIMIHAGTGGNVNASFNFYKNILKRGVNFDVIGLSYYPWLDGTFVELESNLLYLSKHFDQELSIVETAYYSNDWYPEPPIWYLGAKPFPPTEQGQYDYLFQLARIMKKNPRIKTMFYWKPDELEIPKSKVIYIGRSLFDEDGDAFTAIKAWNDIL